MNANHRIEPRTRAVLGDKTTNAKARGAQTVNVKSTIKEIEKSQKKAPTTTRPKQKQPQVETQKLQVHAEETDPLSEEEPEYCPPRPKDLASESDTFPDGVLTFEGLKPENQFKGFYQHYFDPIDENGVSKTDKELMERTRKALEESDKKIREDIENFQWPSIQDEIDETENIKPIASSGAQVRPKDVRTTQTTRKPLGTVTSRNVAKALSMDDATRSMQRKATRVTPVVVARKKTSSFAIPRFTSARPPAPQSTAVRRTPMANIEANSRTTLGYSKGRVAASALASGTAKPEARRAQGAFKPKASGLPRSETTSSTDSDMTITPARFASKQALASAGDELWKERVPFLSIFHPEDEDDCGFAGGPLPELEDEEFEMQLPE
jgi:hypothetical protein